MTPLAELRLKVWVLQWFLFDKCFLQLSAKHSPFIQEKWITESPYPGFHKDLWPHLSLVSKYKNIFFYKFKKWTHNNSQRNNFGGSLTANSKSRFVHNCKFLVFFWKTVWLKNALFSKVPVKKNKKKTGKHLLTTLLFIKD